MSGPVEKKKPNLLGALDAGRRRAGTLLDGPRGTSLPGTSPLDDAAENLIQAEAQTAGPHALWVREWAATAARAVMKTADPEHDAALLARAQALDTRLHALDTEAFAPRQADLRAGRYDAATFLKDIDAMNPAEADAFAQRLLMADRVPPRTTERQAQMVHYLPSPLAAIRAIAHRCQPDDVLCDVGSGLGLVLMLTSWLSGARGLGVEIEPAYTEWARARADDLGFHNLRFVTADARHVDLDGVTIVYVYDTFRGSILSEFIARLRHRATVKPLTVISRGQSNQVFAAQEWLTVVDQEPALDLIFLASSEGTQ